MIISRLILLFSVLLGTFAAAAHADRLDEIKKSGVLRVAVFDSNPPFGYIDAKTHQTIGFDIDIAQTLAHQLGVKLVLRSTNPANRIPLIQSGKVNLIIANFTITPERAKQVSFSLPYFATGQQFIARKNILKTPEDIAALRIGADKGTTQEITLREKYPHTKVISYDDTPLAFAALRNGNVDAITQDGAKLVGLLASLPNQQEYEISPFTLTREYQGIGMPREELRLRQYINEALIALEKSGQADQIYNKWFGPHTMTALPRNFKIRYAH